ncbi:UbiA prenyltransferase family [Mycena latifolia]|nr:UbiA prenyltransferase family [Mycena latifolia]
MNAIAHELRIFWDFTWRDWSASLIPGMMYTLAALRSLTPAPSSTQIACSLGYAFFYFLLYIYAFDIANQINGVAEDRLNKPDRPLPSGRVSMQGAYIRWYLATAAHLLLSTSLGVLPWCALWIAITVYTSFFGGDKHWLTKNLLFMSVGSLCLLHAAWALVAPLTAHEWRWALTLSGVFGIVANVQDMRDVEGDKIAGRRTLPIVLGDRIFRSVMAFAITATPFVCWRLEFLALSHILGNCFTSLLVFSMFYMAFRVFRGRTKKYDHQTYMILTYIYCGCIAVRLIFA